MSNSPEVFDSILEDSLILLKHVHKTGKEIGPNTTKAVLAYRSAKRNNAITQQNEEDILKALNELAQAVKPASVDGIRGSDTSSTSTLNFVSYFLSAVSFGFFKEKSTPLPLAFRSALWYALMAVTILVLLLVILLATTNQLALFETINTNRTAVIQLQDKVEQFEALIDDKLTQLPQLKGNTKEYERLAKEIAELRGEKGKLERGRATALQSLNTNVQVLLQSISAIKYLGRIAGATLTGESRFADGVIGAPAITEAKRAAAFVEIRLVLIERVGFIIPALAAFLGALAYALRGIAREIVEDTFTEESVIQYRLRATLAPLGGISAGLLSGSSFLADGAAPLTQVVRGAVDDNVTVDILALQFTIGFLIGYSIDVFFSIADNIVGTFKGQK